MDNQKKHSFVIRPSECDLNKRLSPQAAAERMEELAYLHAEALGLGFMDLMNVGAFWALTRLTVTFEKLPKLGEEITLQTWPKNMVGLFAVRDWLWFDAQGEIIGRASSSWVLMDIKSRKPRPLESLSGLDFERYPESALEEMPGKIHRAEEGREIRKFNIPLSDLDLNGHVNNAKYFRWLLNAFTQETWKSNWNKIEANYLGEAFPKEEVLLLRSSEGNEQIIDAVSTQRKKTVFRAKISFTG